jgi:hypothetical protein
MLENTKIKLANDLREWCIAKTKPIKITNELTEIL